MNECKRRKLVQRDEPSTSRLHIKTEDEEQSSMMGEKSENQLAIAAASIQGNGTTHPQIFKLDVDCVQEIFDYLSVVDIHSMSQTCKRMQRITRDYFQPNLVGLWIRHGGRGFKALSSYSEYPKPNMDGFKEFIQNLKIYPPGLSSEDNRYIGLHCKSLKKIYFENLYPWSYKIRLEHLKPVLCNIETLTIRKVSIMIDCYEPYLKFCLKLKTLHLCIGTINRWLLQSYPTLQHLKLCTNDRSIDYIPELETFFDRNPSLHNLSLESNLFLQNINAMLQTKLQLQVLTIDLFNYNHENIESIFCHLKTLHAQGFYHRLHLRMKINKQRLCDKISSLDGLEMLSFFYDGRFVSPTVNLLPQLKYLDITLYMATKREMIPIDFELIAKNLPHLEQIFFGQIESETIEPFIQCSANLKSIITLDLIDILDVSSLNQKREQLFVARKVTIYAKENAYLSIKWSNKSTNFKLITIKRYESYSTTLPFLNNLN